MGDNGAKLLAQYIEKGDMPHLKALDVSGNQITSTGHGYFAKAMKNITQEIKIVFESVKGFSKDAFKQSIKEMLYIARSNGITTKEILTTKETVEHCKKGIPNVGVNIVTGFLKCTSKIVKAYYYNGITIGDIASEGLALCGAPLKGIINFTCIAQNTIFSVVDEDFANCLVGADSLLGE